MAVASAAKVRAASAGAAPRFVGARVNSEAQAMADGMAKLLATPGTDEALRLTTVPPEFQVGQGGRLVASPSATWARRRCCEASHCTATRVWSSNCAPRDRAYCMLIFVCATCC